MDTTLNVDTASGLISARGPQADDTPAVMAIAVAEPEFEVAWQGYWCASWAFSTWDQVPINIPVKKITAKVTGSETVGFTVTNTLVVPNYTNVGVRKVWTGEGAADALPDELVVHIVGTDSSDRPVTLNKANHWQATIDELPQIDEHGEWITYTLEERDVPDGFRLVSVEGDVNAGWVVTNEYQKGGGGLTKEARNKSWL